MFTCLEAGRAIIELALQVFFSSGLRQLELKKRTATSTYPLLESHCPHQLLNHPSNSP